MLIIKLIRFVFGYVSFSAHGGFCERFVNLCSLNRIPLWNMKRQGDTLYADTTIKGYKSIRQPAHRSGTQMKIQKKHGLPFFMEHNRRRRGLIIGVAACIILVAFLSRFVWSISVEGNTALTKEQILKAFSENGVKVGALKSRISPEEAAYQTGKLLPELLWSSVNIKGSHVEIVVKERTEAPEFPDTAPCNIVASEDGEIISVQANIGQPQVKAGDMVLKGDLLISGVTKNLDGSENLKAARGNVSARVKKHIDEQGDNAVFTQSEEKSRYILYFFGLKIPLGLKLNEEKYFTSESYISNGKINLPAGIIREHYYSAQNKISLDSKNAVLYHAALYVSKYRDNLLNSTLISESFSFDSIQQSFTGELEIEKDIGSKLEIFVEN